MNEDLTKYVFELYNSNILKIKEILVESYMDCFVKE